MGTGEFLHDSSAKAVCVEGAHDASFMLMHGFIPYSTLYMHQNELKACISIAESRIETKSLAPAAAADGEAGARISVLTKVSFSPSWLGLQQRLQPLMTVAGSPTIHFRESVLW